MPQTATTRRAGAILDLSSVPLEEQGLMCPGIFKGASLRTKIGSSRGRSPFSNRLYLRADFDGRLDHFGLMLSLSRSQFEAREIGEKSLNKIDQLERRLDDLESNQARVGFDWFRNRTNSSSFNGSVNFRRAPAPLAPFAFDRFYKILSKARVVSFDVFDTCLLRVLRRPRDVFWILEERARKSMGLEGVALELARRSAERVARERAKTRERSDGGLYEETNINEIYQVFGELTGMPAELIPRLIGLELDIESEVLFPNPVAQSIIRKCEELGKEIVYTSDMYWGAEVIAGLLSSNGFPEKRLFVSSEIGLTKASGRLYDHLLSKVGCNPWEVVHFGDNQDSDLARTHEKGLSPFHINRDYFERAFVDQSEDRFAYYPKDTLSSLCTGMANRKRLSSNQVDLDGKTIRGAPNSYRGEGKFWYDLGYEIAGPLHFCFLNWLVKKSIKYRLRRLHFLARDGYFLNQFYQKIEEKWGLETESAYVYSSRRLLNFAKIGNLDEDAMDFLSTPNPNLRVEDFLTRIHLDPGEYIQRLAVQGFTNLKTVVTTPNGVFRSLDEYYAMRSFFLSIEDDIVKRASEEKRNLLRFLEFVGFREKKIGVVDIGWQASSILSLRQLLGVDEENELFGFFFGTWSFARKAEKAGCQVESFFFHMDKPETRKSLINESVSLFEILFTAPHPTVTGMEKESGQWEPIYGEPDYEEEELEKLRIMWRGCSEFVDEMVDFLPGPLDSEGFTYLELALNRILREPRFSEAVALGGFRHRESFGGSSPFRYLAKPPAKATTFWNPRRLYKAYEDSQWKSGFLTLLDDDRRRQLIDSRNLAESSE